MMVRNEEYPNPRFWAYKAATAKEGFSVKEYGPRGNSHGLPLHYIEKQNPGPILIRSRKRGGISLVSMLRLLRISIG